MSMIIYTCPKCGADLEEIVLRSYPPQYKKRCRKCGYEYEYIEQSELVRVPFVEPEIAKHNNVVIDLYSNDACNNCSNNPKNGGSGICHCILGTQVTY